MLFRFMKISLKRQYSWPYLNNDGILSNSLEKWLQFKEEYSALQC